MSLPAAVGFVCFNCARTAQCQPYEVDRIACPHVGVTARWQSGAWEYSTPPAKSRQPKRKVDAGHASLAALFRRARTL